MLYHVVRFGKRWLLAALLAALLPGPGTALAQPPAAPSKTALPTLAAAPDPPAIRRALAAAARLAADYKESEALARYQEILKIDPEQYEALWRAAELSVRIGQRYNDITRKSAYFDAARDYADQALALRPGAGESNYAVALALFSQATLRTARGRLEAFRKLRPHVFRAVEQRPDLADAWQLLGRWQYRVAHYNVLERLYSKLILGGVPDGGSSRAAIKSLEQARQLAPQRLQFCYDLARVYRYQGRRRRAIAVLREAQQILPVTSEDLVYSRLCQAMLPPLIKKDERRQRRKARPAAPGRPGKDAEPTTSPD